MPNEQDYCHHERNALHTVRSYSEDYHGVVWRKDHRIYGKEHFQSLSFSSNPFAPKMSLRKLSSKRIRFML
jgi:hypothetical protein